jgi:putative colanic acid biosynthesis acetyltransferase WcaF
VGKVAIHSDPSLRDKVARTLWLVVWALLYRTSPTPFFWWRRFLLQIFGAEVGKNAHPYSSARIWAPWNLVMGAGSCLASGVDCYCVDKVVLGRDAVVSQRAFLCTATHDHREQGFRLMTGPVIIGDDAWIAAEAYIGPGITVGAGAVAGARAVVVHDVPPGLVVVGNPARVVGKEMQLARPAVPLSTAQAR